MPTASSSSRAVRPRHGNGALGSVTGIRHHTAEAHTDQHHAIDLFYFLILLCAVWYIRRGHQLSL